MFSKACEYGIRAMVFIAQKSLHDERVSLKDIAKEIDSPVAFTAKILQQLARNKLIQSIKGPVGGFEMEKRRMKSIMLSDVVNTLDGDGIYKGCGLGLKQCNALKPCPVHEQFAKVRDELRRMLEGTSMYELASCLDQELTFLKR